MPHRVSKRYSNTRSGFDELAEDITDLDTGEFTRIVYGQGVTAETKASARSAEKPTYGVEELLNEIRPYPRTNFRANIKYGGDSQNLTVDARIGPIRTVSFSTDLDQFDHWEDFSQFLSQNKDWQ